MKTKLLLIFSFVLFGYHLSNAQPGALDTSFDPIIGASYIVGTSAIQTDGKIIIGGAFTSYNGISRNYIARLNTDGTLDTSFDPGTGANGVVHTNSIQSDGKIIIGGEFTSYNGTPRNYIARLNTDGTLDASFDPGTGASSFVTTSTIQNDGKIIIGGAFTSYNGISRNYIARLNTDGTLDTSFDPVTGTNSAVRTSSIQSDGKIIIGGQFSSYDGTSRNYIARLNTDGTLGTSFDPGAGASNPVWTTSIQSDGKIIIGGQFTSYDGTGRSRIARLNTDGSLDISFDPGTGTGTSSIVRTTSIQSDGKIIIGGSFSSYDGTGRNCIARLNVDGTLDTSFDPGTGASNPVYASAIQSDGKIIIGGWFTSYDGTPRNYIARLLGCETIGTDIIIACDSYTWIDGNTYTASDSTATDTLTNMAGCDSVVTLNLTINTVDVSVAQDGATLTAGAASATYQWVDCDNNYAPLPGETGQSFTATVNGNYAVVVTENNCTDTSSCYAVIGLSLQTPVAGASLQLFPNPNSGAFTLTLNEPAEFARITITNVLGQIVYDQTEKEQHQKIMFDLPGGVYLVRVQSGEAVYVERMVVAE